MYTSLDDDSNAGVLVFDLGSGLIKAGWAGEDGPRTVKANVIATLNVGEGDDHMQNPDEPEDMLVGDEALAALDRYPQKLNLGFPIQRGEVDDWHAVTRILENLYKKELKVESEKHPVLITDTPSRSKKYRESLADMMFRHFRVPSLAIYNSSVLSLFSTGNTSGIVLELGEGSCHAVPVFEGYALPHAISRLNLAGADLTRHMLKELGVNPRLDIARDIKEKLCAVRVAGEKRSVGSLKYELPDGQMITMSEECSFGTGELLFNPSLSTSPVVGTSTIDPTKGIEGIHHMIYNSIQRCDESLSKDLWKNIVIAGGTSMLQGLPERLHSELISLAGEKLSNQVKIVQESRRKYASWIGGSMFASLSTFSDIKITRQEFEDGDEIVHKKNF